MPSFTVRQKVDKKAKRLLKDEAGNLIEIIEPSRQREAPGVGTYAQSQETYDKFIAKGTGTGQTFSRNERGLVNSRTNSCNRSMRSLSANRKFVRFGG